MNFASSNCQLPQTRAWVHAAIGKLARETARSADTHLLKVDLPGFPGIDFYFKDEAAHPTGSLKHRLARSLFLYALCNGRLREGQAVVDASSGSTAIAEAWFARLLGLSFTAVMPACTAPAKIRAVEALGGACDLVDDPGRVHARAAAHAAQGACHLDQFGPCRTRDRLARQQQHRRIDPRPARARAAAGTGVDRLRRGHRRHLGHDRPLPALPATADAVVRRRTDRQRLRPWLARIAIPRRTRPSRP